MPELIDVLLDDLEEGNKYSVIFPLELNGDHEAYITEFLHSDYGQFLFKVVDIISDPDVASKHIGEQFTINLGEQTTDINDRTKYMILEEQYIPFPPALDDAHIDPTMDEELNRILDERDNNSDESERSRRLRIFMLGRRRTQSPLVQRAQSSPFLNSRRTHTPAGGRGRRYRRRTHSRPSRRRPSQRRSRPRRPRRTRRRMRIRRSSRPRT